MVPIMGTPQNGTHDFGEKNICKFRLVGTKPSFSKLSLRCRVQRAPVTGALQCPTWFRVSGCMVYRVQGFRV